MLESRALLASVAWDDTGDLIYTPTAVADRIPDFSTVGYRGGIVGIPNVPTVLSVLPVAGDDTAMIQAAINQVAAMPLNANGFRGALLLKAGEYQINGQLTINASGVVLRGEGDGPAGTVLRATGTTQRTLVRFAGSGSRSTVSGTTHQVVDQYVPVGARSFHVDSTSGLAVGETVIVNRPTTTEWVAAIGMNLLDNPWVAGNHEPNWDRVITRIEGNSITVDAPLTNSLDLGYGGGNIRQYTWSGRINNVGIESLRGISDYIGDTDVNHATWLVEMSAMENGWVRDLTAYNFRQGIVTLTSTSKWVTVEECESYDPKSPIIGGERYTYNVNGQLILVQNSHASQGRHDYVFGSAVPGPNVFFNNTAVNAYSDSGPHHRWSTGGLFDNLDIDGHQINVQNRGNLGTGHGFAGANMVIWNSTADGFIVHNPPTAQNWLIGSTGPISPGSFYVGPHDPGTVESHGSAVQPRSLYQAQLQERMAYPKLDYREYWVGDVDGFYSSSGTGNNVTVDAAWQSQVMSVATAALSNFDNLSNPQTIPFTFNFSLDPGDQIVGAVLSFGLRATASDLSNNRIYLDSLTDNPTFASLGWTNIASTGTTTKVLNLANRLSSLQDGRLNVAIQQNTAVDWAVLNLQVAPSSSLKLVTIAPQADTYVRGGTYATQNFGSDTSIVTKEDTSPDVDRRAYLRFDLSSIRGQVERATLRLVPTSVGTLLIENRASFVADDTWGESTINWNNQPEALPFGSRIVNAGEPFEILVTPLVHESISSNGLLSFRIDSTTNLGGPGFVNYASKENSSAALRPVLVLEMTPASVANRRVFYNRSTSTVFGNGSGNPIGSIDTTKVALLPGQTTSFSNVTNYSKGINGIIVDVAGLNGTPTASDFKFATATGELPLNFIASSVVPTITVIPNAGQNNSQRLKIEFADNAVRNTWLRVTVLAGPNIGLTANDVFYFGSAVGEMNVGNAGTPTILRTDNADAIAVRQNQSSNAGVSNIFDINKDGRVNPLDLAVLNQNRRNRILRYFTAPVNLSLALPVAATSAVKLSTPSVIAPTPNEDKRTTVDTGSIAPPKSDPSAVPSIALNPLFIAVTPTSRRRVDAAQTAPAALTSKLNEPTLSMPIASVDKLFSTY